MLQVTQADLDADHFALNAPVGTIDLTSGQMYEHDYGDFITKQTTVDPTGKGQATWLAALEVFFQGDSELINYVQRIVGLTAIGKVYVEPSSSLMGMVATVRARFGTRSPGCWTRMRGIFLLMCSLFLTAGTSNPN